MFRRQEIKDAIAEYDRRKRFWRQDGEFIINLRTIASRASEHLSLHEQLGLAIAYNGLEAGLGKACVENFAEKLKADRKIATLLEIVDFINRLEEGQAKARAAIVFFSSAIGDTPTTLMPIGLGLRMRLFLSQEELLSVFDDQRLVEIISAGLDTPQVESVLKVLRKLENPAVHPIYSVRDTMVIFVLGILLSALPEALQTPAVLSEMVSEPTLYSSSGYDAAQAAKASYLIIPEVLRTVPVLKTMFKSLSDELNNRSSTLSFESLFSLKRSKAADSRIPLFLETLPRDLHRPEFLIKYMESWPKWYPQMIFLEDSKKVVALQNLILAHIFLAAEMEDKALEHMEKAGEVLGCADDLALRGRFQGPAGGAGAASLE